MNDAESEKIRTAVRDHYGKVAEVADPGCAPGCCGPGAQSSLRLGYSEDDLAALPVGADLGLGCGNAQAIANLRPGDTVVDLGSGAGFDCFLAARKVAPSGKVIGVDMTAGLVAKARENAQRANVQSVEFRLGEIEHLPIADACADVILSNCVINLVPDKKAAFTEAFRVLKPGGRLAISDVVTTAPLPPSLQSSRRRRRPSRHLPSPPDRPAPASRQRAVRSVDLSGGPERRRRPRSLARPPPSGRGK